MMYTSPWSWRRSWTLTRQSSALINPSTPASGGPGRLIGRQARGKSRLPGGHLDVAACPSQPVAGRPRLDGGGGSSVSLLSAGPPSAAARGWRPARSAITRPATRCGGDKSGDRGCGYEPNQLLFGGRHWRHYQCGRTVIGGVGAGEITPANCRGIGKAGSSHL